jgi:hypothetical protein
MIGIHAGVISAQMIEVITHGDWAKFCFIQDFMSRSILTVMWESAITILV